MFLTSLALYIKQKDRLRDNIDSVKQTIKQRVSYYGIYNFFEQFDEQQLFVLSLEQKLNRQIDENKKIDEVNKKQRKEIDENKSLIIDCL